MQINGISVKLFKLTKTGFEKFTVNMLLTISAEHNAHSFYFAFISTLC